MFFRRTTHHVQGTNFLLSIPTHHGVVQVRCLYLSDLALSYPTLGWQSHSPLAPACGDISSCRHLSCSFLIMPGHLLTPCTLEMPSSDSPAWLDTPRILALSLSSDSFSIASSSSYGTVRPSSLESTA